MSAKANAKEWLDAAEVDDAAGEVVDVDVTAVKVSQVPTTDEAMTTVKLPTEGLEEVKEKKPSVGLPVHAKLAHILAVIVSGAIAVAVAIVVAAAITVAVGAVAVAAATAAITVVLVVVVVVLVVVIVVTVFVTVVVVVIVTIVAVVVDVIVKGVVNVVVVSRRCRGQLCVYTGQLVSKIQ